MAESQNTPETPGPRSDKRPIVKRRWAIVSRAGGGAAVLAVAGALALGDPNDQTDFGQDAGGSSSQVSSES